VQADSAEPRSPGRRARPSPRLDPLNDLPATKVSFRYTVFWRGSQYSRALRWTFEGLHHNDAGMHLAERTGMKTFQFLWAPLVGAVALSACGGLGQVEATNDDSTGNAGAPAVTGPTGSGGLTIGTTTASGGSMGAGGAASSTGIAVAPPAPAIVDGSGYTSSVPPMAIDGTGAPSTTSVTTTTAIDAQGPLAGGQLTAGTWDDNLNFSFYSSYLSTTAAAQLSGMPIIERSNRMVILVKDASGQPMAGAQVSVADAAGHNWNSTTGAEGRVVYFPEWASVVAGTTVGIVATVADLNVSTTATASAGTVELTLAQGTLPTVGALDLAFVIDTTGSMGDELSYVQRELDGIVGGIAEQFPGIAQRFALVVYRDEGDDYVVRSFDFTSDLASFRANLATQRAEGGNDMPEAVDQGLTAASQLGWSRGAVARVAFWIADAPHHVGKENAVTAALAAAVANAVHIYPVAASGIDDLGEFVMRTAAEVTGGRYLFLTNDSGIGGSHAEPHIPCYYVTTLTLAMRRMVASEVTGTYMPPAVSDILRTGGDPQNQQCTLSTGEPVTAW